MLFFFAAGSFSAIPSELTFKLGSKRFLPSIAVLAERYFVFSGGKCGSIFDDSIEILDTQTWTMHTGAMQTPAQNLPPAMYSSVGGNSTLAMLTTKGKILTVTIGMCVSASNL